MNNQNIVPARPGASSQGVIGAGLRTLARYAGKRISSFERALRASKWALGLSLFAALGSSAVAADFTCTPTEVAVYPNRAHVRCTTPQTDGSATISFWAIPNTDAQQANRFIAITSTALVSGRTLVLRYTPGDVTGQSFGCLSTDCRTVIMFSVR